MALALFRVYIFLLAHTGFKPILHKLKSQQKACTKRILQICTSTVRLTQEIVTRQTIHLLTESLKARRKSRWETLYIQRGEFIVKKPLRICHNLSCVNYIEDTFYLYHTEKKQHQKGQKMQKHQNNVYYTQIKLRYYRAV